MPLPESIILRTLLSSPERFVTGTELAGVLNLSRVAVWGHIKKLRQEGVCFEAVRNRGYRICGFPERLSLPYLEALLPPSITAEALVFHPVSDSTNSEAERLLAGGKETPFVVLARQQSRGRGRMGRTWFSNDEGNLYASFVFRPHLPPGRMERFTLWMGATLCRFIETFTGVKLGLKWPNDLYYKGRKAGGMLTEARMDRDRTRDLVFGLGLNVNSDPGRWPMPFAKEATSLKAISGAVLDMNALTAALIEHVLDAYGAFQSEAYAADFPALWENYDIMKGREAVSVQGTQTITGRVLGIDSEGSLRLQEKNGNILSLRSGEVTLKNNLVSPDSPFP